MKQSESLERALCVLEVAVGIRLPHSKPESKEKLALCDEILVPLGLGGYSGYQLSALITSNRVTTAMIHLQADRIFLSAPLHHTLSAPSNRAR
jgi:hypothetical protein